MWFETVLPWYVRTCSRIVPQIMLYVSSYDEQTLDLLSQMTDAAFSRVNSTSFNMSDYQAELSILLTIADRMYKNDPGSTLAGTAQTLLSFLEKVYAQLESRFRGMNDRYDVRSRALSSDEVAVCLIHINTCTLKSSNLSSSAWDGINSIHSVWNLQNIPLCNFSMQI